MFKEVCSRGINYRFVICLRCGNVFWVLAVRVFVFLVWVWCSLSMAAVAKVMVRPSRLRTIGVSLMPHGV